MSLPHKALDLLHRRVWQRLPPRLRRAAFAGTTAFLAPRRKAPAPLALPIFVAGALQTASGLGQSARLCYDALRRIEPGTLPVDLSGALMQPLDLPGIGFADIGAHAGPGTIILHVNGPLVPLALMALGRTFVAQKHIVAYWAWELEEVPGDWRQALRFIDSIWVPSRFVADAVSRMAGDIPVHVVPHPLPAPPTRKPTGDPGPFRVLTVFNRASGFARKNPVAAIAAFKAAFGDDPAAELIVKSSHLAESSDQCRALRSAIAGRTNISLMDAIGSPAELDELYASVDSVISLHRSEGFGLVPAEAMLRGLPVVATNWSGNVDFMTEANACPVRCTLVPAHDPASVYHHPQLRWAEPDVAHAALLLRRLESDSDLRLRLGQQATRDAARFFSLDSYRARVAPHLPLSQPSR